MKPLQPLHAPFRYASPLKASFDEATAFVSYAKFLQWGTSRFKIKTKVGEYLVLKGCKNFSYNLFKQKS